MKEVIITKNNFTSEVLESDIPVLVDFWATWCGPCKMLSPIIAEIAEEFDGKVKVGKINVDDEPDLAVQFRIVSIPTVLVFKNGEVVNKAIGYQSKEQMVALLPL
jgi:thioredoxin 1